VTVDILEDYISDVRKRVTAYLLDSPGPPPFQPEDLREAALAYLQRPAKGLRPALVSLAAGATGGAQAEQLALPLAAAVEVFHVWTLVHDDIIDNDPTRRRGPAAHVLAARRASREGLIPNENLNEYGRDTAILAGDALHGWTVTILSSLYPSRKAELVLELIRAMETDLLTDLLHGEALDTRFGLVPLRNLARSRLSLDEKTLLNVSRLKTAALLEYCAAAGTLLALNDPSRDHPHVRAMTSFARHCGIAFQLRDDILGISGNADRMGKSVESDIRQGKKTVIFMAALSRADADKRRELLALYGNPAAPGAEIERARQLLQELGGLDHAARLAADHLSTALRQLKALPDSKYSRLLADLARTMAERNH